MSVKNPYLDGANYWPTRIAAIRFYKAGRSRRATAELVGVSSSTVRRWLIASDIERRTPGQGKHPMLSDDVSTVPFPF